MKKWSKLVLATMVSAGTLLVSGCIENLEPEGIADLRGAKAELLRAQTALQAAQAAKVEAEAALVLAQAKVQEAIAKQEEAKVAFIEAQTLAEQYRAEYQKLVNEAYAQEQEDAHQKRMYELEKLIAEQEAAMATAAEAAALAAEEFKISMLDVTRRLAEAQLQYDKAMDDIEISRNTLTEKQQAYLWERLMAVEELKSSVASLTEELEDATDELADAAAELDEPTAQRVAIKKAERAVAKFQAKYEAALEAEEVALALLELDPMVTDWDAKREEIEDQQKALEKERDAKAVEAADRAKVWRDSIDLLDDAAQKYSAATGYDFDNETGLFSKVPNSYQGAMEEFDVPEVYVPAPKDDEGNSLFGGDFELNAQTYSYGNEKYVVEEFEKALKNLEQYNEDTYQAQVDLFEKLLAEHQGQPEYKAAMAKYNDAVAAYNAGDLLPYVTKYVFDDDDDLQAEIDDYNAAIKAFGDAVKAYEDEDAKHKDGDDTDIYKAYDDACAAAVAARAKAYQTALDQKMAAEKTYAEAQSKYETAKTNYEITLSATEDLAGVDYATMKAEVDAYDALVAGGGTTPDADTKALIDKYRGYVKTIEAAMVDTGTETDAQSVYDAAVIAWNKAQSAYYAALNTADVAYDNSIKKAATDRDNALRELAATSGGFNSEYKAYLEGVVTDAVSAIESSVWNIRNLVGSLTAINTYDFFVEYAEGDRSNWFYDIPDFCLNIELDSDNDVVYTFVPVTLADIQDLDHFRDNTVTTLASNLLSFTGYFSYWAYDEFNTWIEPQIEFYYGTLTNYDGYPLELPDFETAQALFDEHLNDMNQQMSWNDPEQLFYNWYPNGTIIGYYHDYSLGLAVVKCQYEQSIEEYKTEIANLELLPDFIKAIEAAKAEFEAYAAEKAAEIDALKADVEANYPRLLEELEAVMEDADAFTEKVAALNETLATLNMLISKYCEGFTDLDDFVASLEDKYETALQTTWDVEKKLINAEKALADLKEGLVTAVEAAQKTFDQVTEELAEAQALLDFAVEELEKAIELIYGDEELPEDPAPENPAPEDPGTGDEGGEEETPAA